MVHQQSVVSRYGVPLVFTAAQQRTRPVSRRKMARVDMGHLSRADASYRGWHERPHMAWAEVKRRTTPPLEGKISSCRVFYSLESDCLVIPFPNVTCNVTSNVLIPRTPRQATLVRGGHLTFSYKVL